MSAYRIRIARDVGDFVKSIVDFNDGSGPFQTYADAMAFCAAFGAKYDRYCPIENTAREPGPIDLDIFQSRGYDTLIRLLAIYRVKEPKILLPEAEGERVKIFEEYAHGGAIRLERELKGAIDYTERLLLVISQERFPSRESVRDFDLTRFL